MKKRTMNVNIPVTDEQIERLEKLLPKVRDEIIKRYKDIFDEDAWDQLGPIYADVFEYIADKESNSFVVGILVNILISNEEKDQARARHEQKNQRNEQSRCDVECQPVHRLWETKEKDRQLGRAERSNQ